MTRAFHLAAPVMCALAVGAAAESTFSFEFGERFPLAFEPAVVDAAEGRLFAGGEGAIAVLDAATGDTQHVIAMGDTTVRDLQARDMDDDRRVDIFAGLQAPGGPLLVLIRQNGVRTFDPPVATTVLPRGELVRAVVYDANGDDYLDAAVVAGFQQGAHAGTLILFEGRKGGFGEGTVAVGTETIRDVAVVPGMKNAPDRLVISYEDGYGVPRIAFVEKAPRSTRDAGSARAARPWPPQPASPYTLSPISGAHDARYLAVGDVDGDGADEILGVNGAEAFLLDRQRNGSWARWPSAPLFAAGGRPVAADADGNGSDEFYVPEPSESQVAVLRKTSRAGLEATERYHVGRDCASVAFDDEAGDLVSIDTFDSSVRVLAGEGSGFFAGARVYTVAPDAATPIAFDPSLYDMDGDGRMDVVVWEDAWSIWRARMDGFNRTPIITLEGEEYSSPDQHGELIHVGDENQDGLGDLTFAHPGASTLAPVTYLQAVDSYFDAAPWLIELHILNLPAYRNATWGDLDGDLALDVLHSSFAVIGATGTKPPFWYSLFTICETNAFDGARLGVASVTSLGGYPDLSNAASSCQVGRLSSSHRDDLLWQQFDHFQVQAYTVNSDGGRLTRLGGILHLPGGRLYSAVKALDRIDEFASVSPEDPLDWVLIESGSLTVSVTQIEYVPHPYGGDGVFALSSGGSFDDTFQGTAPPCDQAFVNLDVIGWSEFVTIEESGSLLIHSLSEEGIGSVARAGTSCSFAEGQLPTFAWPDVTGDGLPDLMYWTNGRKFTIARNTSVLAED